MIITVTTDPLHNPSVPFQKGTEINGIFEKGSANLHPVIGLVAQGGK